MTSEGLVNSFWTHYIMLEKEFMATMEYVRISTDNYKTYSDAYAKLLLQIGSEIDIVAKETCYLLDPTFTGNKMDQYKPILASNGDFINAKVKLINYDITLDPWNDFESKQPGNNKPPAIKWWKAYNKVKHERMNTVSIDDISQESYKFANQEYVLKALGALYHLLLHSYYLILKNEGKKVDAPLPGSRLFNMTGTVWNGVTFSFDTSFDIEDGCLILKTSTIPY